jgi:hypothetical protein
MPYFLLTSSRSKCFSVVAPQGESIHIWYHAPGKFLFQKHHFYFVLLFLLTLKKFNVLYYDYVDLRIPEGVDDGILTKEAILQKLNDPGEEAQGNFGEAGLDSEYQRRMNNRSNSKRPEMSDMSITVKQKVPSRSASRQRGDPGDDATVRTKSRVREEISQQTGFINFKTIDEESEEGGVDICVQSIVASPHTPVRFNLYVDVNEDMAEDSWIDSFVTNEVVIQTMEQVNEAKVVMSQLEKDMRSLTNRVRTIMNSADYNKEQEAEFHDQSVQMNRAASYWPIIRLIFLFLTGFVQVNHIITYMKSRHII